MKEKRIDWHKLVFNNYQYIVFLLIALILVFSWFHGMTLLAEGEDGLIFYRPGRSLSLFLSPWLETGTGISIPFYLSRIPFFAIAAFLNNFFAIWIVQMLMFLTLLVVGMVSMYYFVKNLAFTKFIAFLSAIFYLLNTFTQSQVWGRFIYGGIFAWSYLPLFMLVFFNWLRTGKKRWMMLMIISSFIFSNSFTQPAFIFTFFIPSIILFLYLFKIQTTRRKRIQISINALIFAIFFILVNIWWIYPLLLLTRIPTITGGTSQGNLQSLIGVSSSFPTPTILLLKQNYVFGPIGVIHDFFSHPLMWMINYFITFVFVIGVIISRTSKYFGLIIIGLLVGWFVSKGANPPLGETFFKFLFETIPFSAVLRNPYEKFGIVFVLFFAISFSVGLSFIFSRIGKKLSIIIAILVFIVYLFPFWTGAMYRSSQVRIPKYYNEVRTYINSLKDQGRVLSLPMLPGDGLRYLWGDSSYIGVEMSEIFFDREPVSKMLRDIYFDPKYFELYSALTSNGNYNHFLDEMAIDTIVLHHDIDPSVGGASPSANVAIQLSANPEIKFNKQIGKLSIYTYNGDNELFKIDNDDGIKFTYKKYSPSHYEVYIENAKKDYDLIFKNTYSNLWIARIDGKEQIEHSMIYNFANVWKIRRQGDYTIEIVFKIWPWE